MSGRLDRGDRARRVGRLADRSMFFTVDETQQALVLRFGKPVATIVKPGL